MSKPMILAVLIAAAAAPAVQAHDGGAQLGCEVGTDWKVQVHGKGFHFTREDGSSLGIGGGRVFSGGREITLSEADHRRVAGIESELRALVPEMRQVGREAVEIAFTALTEVARALSSTPDKTVAGLQDARKQSLAAMDATPLSMFNDDAMGDVVEPILEKFVPDIIGGAVGSALKAAFSGEAQRQEMQSRMERMERELHENVDARAKALEPLAKAMCQRIGRMDEADNALEFRLPGGAAPDLFRVGHSVEDAKP